MVDTIDLNTANRETLATLPGIGEALAERIVAFREEVHPFEEVIELAAVSGISERMVRNVEDLVTVNVAPAEDIAEPPEEAPQAGAEEEPIGEEEPEEVAVGPEPVVDESWQEEQEAVSIPVEATAETVEEPAATGPDEEEPVPDQKTSVSESEAEGPRAVATAEAIEAAERAVAAPDATESGRGWGCTLLGILAGAIAGALLTLFFLFLLNGTLLFGGRGQMADLEQEVLMQGRDQQALDAEVADASADLATVASAQETAAASQRSTADEVEELASDLDDLETDVVPAVATLEAQTAAQATRLSGIAAAAASFDAFLTRMRDLLIDLQGLPPTPTGTPSPSPSPPATAGTATPSATSPAADETQTATPAGPSPTPTWTPRATRTPRPTATPIVRPTATPTD